MPRTLTALRSPAPFSTAKSMIWLFPSLTLAFCLGPGNTVSQTSSTPLIVNGVVGESVTLTLKFPVEEKIMSITWLHAGKSIIFIEPNEALNRVTDPKRKNQLKVIESYSLQISNLTMADTGPYSAQITTLTSSLFTSYDLRIFRRLRNLQVVPHTKWSKNRTCEIHLTCSVDNPNDSILFRWQVSGNTLQSDANLTISWDPKSFDEETYTCVAENPVSNSSFSVSVKSLCQSVTNEKNEHLDTMWIVVAVSSICIVVVIIVLFVWRKKIGFFQFSTQQTQCPGEQTVSNLEYASFSPGNTVYAQVTHSNREMEIPKPVKNNDTTTIYSEVQQSQEKAHLFQDNCPSPCHVRY
ncbi:SLAM family member 6 [Physeter macrocephalus]|uniref:SLAM family member 6 n=1 Tax=Physeter macrocephalus TaxID=9755 RepID=A0A2Y9S2V7_PHYMC|nr:SLAM family member 6 [Physeter catodon]|eukprot:XP_023971762.1 SLAM family member 6 [Physeter catodon]